MTAHSVPQRIKVPAMPNVKTPAANGFAGSAIQIKGAVKQAVGKGIGDAKLEADGKADTIKGRIRNSIGVLKDTLKSK